MTSPGNVLVVHGDITWCQASAVVFSTSTELEGEGHLYSAFAKIDGFAAWYRSLPRKPPASVGDTDWWPAPETSSLRPPVALIYSVKGKASRDPVASAGLCLGNVLMRVEKELDATGELHSTKRPSLVLIPALLLGKGGGGAHRREIAERMVDIALEHAARSGMDVAFTMITKDLFAVFREALRRRRPSSITPPSDLSSSLRSGQCALFIGSGLSTAAGLAGWNTLIEKLGARAGIKFQPTDVPGVDYALRLAVAQEYRLRQEATGSALPSVRSMIRDVLGPVRPPAIEHYLIAQTGARFIFTTNYDRLIEEALMAARRPFHRVACQADLPRSSRGDLTQVIKLHGDVGPSGNRSDAVETSDPYARPILSSKDYDAFSTDRAAFYRLLGGLMVNHRLLFVGYSLADENIREIWDSVIAARGGNTAAGHTEAFGLRYLGKETEVPGLTWFPEKDSTEAHATDADRTRAYRAQLHALSEHAPAIPEQVLAPTRAGQSDRTPLLAALEQLGDRVHEALDARSAPSAVLALVAELLCDLGWQGALHDPLPGIHAIWKRLADAATEQEQKARFLRTALAYATNEDDAERLRRALHEIEREERTRREHDPPVVG